MSAYFSSSMFSIREALILMWHVFESLALILATCILIVIIVFLAAIIFLQFIIKFLFVPVLTNIIIAVIFAESSPGAISEGPKEANV